MNEATFLVANSHNTERILLDEWEIPRERIRLLYPGADCNRFKPVPHDPTVRQALRWGERPVVLTVGRLQKRKGHDQMIRALPQILERVPDVLYAVVGAGDERPLLEKLTADLGLGEHVIFHGEVDDEAMLACYQQCDLFVLPNRQIGSDIEGFGMVLVEAQACGKPVIAGASGGTAETMDIPDTGKVVSCEEPHQLAGLVTSWLLDASLRHRMGTAARAWAVSRFDWPTLSQQAAELFRSIPRRGTKEARPTMKARVGDLPVP